MQGAVTLASATPGAPEGHDAAMVARFEAGQVAAAAGVNFVPTAPVVPPVTPVVAPVVQPAVVPATPAPEVTPAVPPVVAPQADFVDNLLTSAGLTRDALAAEFMAGGLTADSYAKLASKGVNKEAVDNYFAGVQAQIDGNNTAYETAIIAATVGTAEKYAEITGWASKSLTPVEVKAFNDAVSSGEQARAAFAVAGLQARFMAANPAEPALLSQGVPSGGIAGFESLAQMKEAMRDPKYAKDSAYREQVRVRLAASGVLR